MIRLPKPGADDGVWGTLLNDYLSVEMQDNGTLKIRTDGTLSNLAHTTGNETIAGVKTFTSSPVVPTPTGDYQVATKKYVDDAALGGDSPTPDATTSSKGVVQLAGDLGGTAASPTVPGLASKVSNSRTDNSPPAAPILSYTRAYAVSYTDEDIMVFSAGTSPTPTAWLNEWGGYRARPLYNWDAGIRLIAHASQSGNIIEYQNNARDVTLWGINPQGHTVMSGVQMSPVLVLGPDDPVPAGTPAGTVILRT